MVPVEVTKKYFVTCFRFVIWIHIVEWKKSHKRFSTTFFLSELLINHITCLRSKLVKINFTVTTYLTCELSKYVFPPKKKNVQWIFSCCWLYEPIFLRITWEMMVTWWCWCRRHPNFTWTDSQTCVELYGNSIMECFPQSDSWKTTSFLYYKIYEQLHTLSNCGVLVEKAIGYSRPLI